MQSSPKPRLSLIARSIYGRVLYYPDPKCDLAGVICSLRGKQCIELGKDIDALKTVFEVMIAESAGAKNV